jgi:peptidoglycan/xylan/chitin deacetylase (PgdA/CDA1 family)
MDDRHAWLGTVARGLGGAALSRRLVASNNVRVAMTHFVPEADLDQFDRIVRFLSRERKAITPDRFFRHYAVGSPEPIDAPSVLFTFDDGLLSSFRAAQQVLNPLGVKAIFFVPTAILELRTHAEMREFAHARVYFGNAPSNGMRPEQYETMNVEHLRELHEQGHRILPHTHSHPRARDIATSEDAARELVGPKAILEDLLQSPVDGFALPVGTPGSVSVYAYRQIASVYSVCLTSLGGTNTLQTDRLFIRRDSIHPWYSLDHVRNIVDGMFDPYFAVKANLLERRVGRKRLSAPRGAFAMTRDAASPGDDLARASFIAAVADAFEHGGVEHVFLHGYGRERTTDSDVDVAVGRDSLDRADAIIRAGAFGRLVQCLHHDVPFSRYYVVEVDEHGRSYRQLDVVCDPRGIGRDGIAVPVALASAVPWRGIRIPNPAAEALYLAVKRARKRRHGRSDQGELARAFRRDSRGAARLLEQHFGAAGRRLASALEQGQADLTEELEALRKRVMRRRRSPAALARRSVLVPLRIAGRLRRPTGLAVSIVGPDEGDKSALTSGLERRTDGLFRRVEVLAPRHRLRSLERLTLWPNVVLGRARASLVLLDGASIVPRPDLSLVLDGSSSSEATLERALRDIGDCLAARQHAVGDAARSRSGRRQTVHGAMHNGSSVVGGGKIRSRASG